MKRQNRKYNNLNTKISKQIISVVMNSKNWNQRELASAINVHQSTITKVLSEKRTMSFEVFSRILVLLTDEDCNEFIFRLKNEK